MFQRRQVRSTIFKSPCTLLFPEATTLLASLHFSSGRTAFYLVSWRQSSAINYLLRSIATGRRSYNLLAALSLSWADLHQWDRQLTSLSGFLSGPSPCDLWLCKNFHDPENVAQKIVRAHDRVKKCVRQWSKKPLSQCILYAIL